MNLRTLLYLVACRLRSIHLTLINAVILAGAGALIGYIPIPLPIFFREPLAIGVAIFLMTRFTEAELFPDVFFIPFVIELATWILMDQVLRPMLI